MSGVEIKASATDLHGMVTRTEADLFRFYELCDKYKSLDFSRDADGLRECASMLRGILVDGSSIMCQLSIIRFSVYKFMKGLPERSTTAQWKIYMTELDTLIAGLRSVMFGYQEASKANRELLFDMWSTEKRDKFQEE
ncbi:MAG: hypothetical protein M0P69_19645 [Bacteroidales bacterium]|jgi:hypothetical protein|nr:hypothetical protein [Bacteroidales bacterium]